MTKTHLGLIGFFFLLLALVVGRRDGTGAHQLQQVPSAEDVRFQLIGNEPVAAPDGISLVGGWTVLMFRDRRANQCYVAFERDGSIGVVEAAACPP